MRTLLILLVAFASCPAFSQAYVASIRAFQEELNAEYRDPDESPLPAKQRKAFEGLPFFDIDSSYHVVASFTRNEAPVTFQMQTTSAAVKDYDIYGTVTFTLKGTSYTLNIYQSHTLRETDEYRDYLFLPFTDKTNGDTTYGGGRYIDLRIPSGDTIDIDFNKAYNPYCAYATGYSCPIPPRENDMPVKIEAGVKYESSH